MDPTVVRWRLACAPSAKQPRRGWPQIACGTVIALTRLDEVPPQPMMLLSAEHPAFSLSYMGSRAASDAS